MVSEERLLWQLSQAGYRVTRPRRAVIRVLLEDGSYASPAEVRERARAHCPSVGLVTVYRTLDLLASMGFVRRIHTEDGCHGYSAAEHGHRHHLVCRQCGATVEFEGCDLSSFLARVGHDTGYIIEDHLLELVGLCTACRPPAVGAPGTASPQDTDKRGEGRVLSGGEGRVLSGGEGRVLSGGEGL